jgi:hypothetical protein
VGFPTLCDDRVSVPLMRNRRQGHTLYRSSNRTDEHDVAGILADFGADISKALNHPLKCTSRVEEIVKQGLHGPSVAQNARLSHTRVYLVG